MADKMYPIVIEENYDDYLGLIHSQSMYSKDRTLGYYVRNLTDCPEDAIINRDLVSAEEIINYIKFGMKLAQEGYTKIQVEYINITDEEE